MASAAVPAYDPLAAEPFGEIVEFVYQMYSDYPGQLQPPLPAQLASSYEVVAYINAADVFGSLKETVFYGVALRALAAPTQIVIAIRGTEGFLEWLIDFEIRAVPWPVAGAAHVEEGFLSVLETMRFVTPGGQSLERADWIKSTLLGLADPQIVIVGHSLGGALVTLLSAELLSAQPALNQHTTVYTFASPSLGDATFATFYNQTVQHSFRIWNELDSVPRVLNLFYTQVNGTGHELVQSIEQMVELHFSLECEHAMMTYLWLIKPDNQFVTSGDYAKLQCLRWTQADVSAVPSGKQALISDRRARRAATGGDTPL